jgi:hypothetical protein
VNYLLVLTTWQVVVVDLEELPLVLLVLVVVELAHKTQAMVAQTAWQTQVAEAVAALVLLAGVQVAQV